MRDIKFRVWDRQNKEFSNWTNRDPFLDLSTGKVFFWERTRNEDGSYGGDIIIKDEGDRFILQQFTGLKDKNGKGIYEGDIIKDFFGKIGEVRWISRLEGWDYSGWDSQPAYLPWRDEAVEIIGNIYENTE